MADMSYPDDWFEVERLHRAARDGDVKEIERLVAAHYDVNLFDDLSRAPLHYAVEGEHYKAAEWLLNHGAGVNRYEDEKIGETALCFAVEQDYPEMVELLMKHGADPDIPGWMGQTARYRAYKRKDEDGKKICSILERYARPNK